MATSSLTERLLGRIKTEAKTDYEGESPDTAWSVTNYRPEGVGLRNDGYWYYWLAWNADPVLTVEWDGIGWHVDCRSWLKDHVWRLADDHREFVSHLPLADGVVELDKARRYELRTVRERTFPSGWDLYEMPAN